MLVVMMNDDEQQADYDSYVGIDAIWEKDPPTPPSSPRADADDSATVAAAAALPASAASSTDSASAGASKGPSKAEKKVTTGTVPVLAVVKLPSLTEVM